MSELSSEDLQKIGKAFDIITTQICENPFWMYSLILTREEVLDFFEKREKCDLELLKRVSYYILTYAENTALACFIINEFDSNYLKWMMECLKKLRELHNQISKAKTPKEAYKMVCKMIHTCLEHGIDPF